MGKILINTTVDDDNKLNFLEQQFKIHTRTKVFKKCLNMTYDFMTKAEAK